MLLLGKEHRREAALKMLDCYSLIEILWAAIRECLDEKSAEELSKNSQLVTQLFLCWMLTFVSFTGISQLLEATTDLFWRPRLARSLIYII